MSSCKGHDGNEYTGRLGVGHCACIHCMPQVVGLYTGCGRPNRNIRVSPCLVAAPMNNNKHMTLHVIVFFTFPDRAEAHRNFVVCGNQPDPARINIKCASLVVRFCCHGSSSPRRGAPTHKPNLCSRWDDLFGKKRSSGSSSSSIDGKAEDTQKQDGQMCEWGFFLRPRSRAARRPKGEKMRDSHTPGSRAKASPADHVSPKKLGNQKQGRSGSCTGRRRVKAGFRNVDTTIPVCRLA